MITIQTLIWDEWNVGHIRKHNLSIQNVEEALHQIIEIKDAYRNRYMVIGKTESNKILCVVLSSEDRDKEPYATGTYYPITAYERE